MTNAMLEKRMSALEKVVREMQQEKPQRAPARLSKTAPTALTPKKQGQKKLPRWLEASLKDEREGRISGPFNTVEELMAHLEK
ncbi:MAG: hypothetical protein Q7S95_00680 [bacterium]|nr:hypothetical protein [bacterium]